MNNKGFTLLEILLAVAIIAIISGIGLQVFRSFQVRNDIDIATVTIANSLRRAQLLSQANEYDSTWGVFVGSGVVTVFRGTSYAARSDSFDETFTLPSSITPSGLQEVTFSQTIGNPTSTGVVTLTTSTNETRSISINEKGTVSY